MTTQKYWLAIAAVVTSGGLTGCSSLLGLNKEPSLADDQPAIDAAVDTRPIDAMVDMDTSACAGMNCGVFGCDTANNVCRPAKLWVFLSGGQFMANGFGGIDNTVRATADGKCFMTASSADFANRACSQNRTHAILTVTSADSIAAMSANFSIPTTAEVHRIDDDVLVFNNWNDLTGMVMPRTTVASATIAPTDADGIVWTGNTTTNCAGWTSNASTTPGVIGHTAGTPGGQNNWLNTGSVPCNTGPFQHLLCVCWSGGN